MSGHGAAAWLLVGAGTDVQGADDEGLTPLHWSAMRGHEAVVSVLVEAGADVHMRVRPLSTGVHCTIMGPPSACC